MFGDWYVGCGLVDLVVWRCCLPDVHGDPDSAQQRSHVHALGFLNADDLGRVGRENDRRADDFVPVSLAGAHFRSREPRACSGKCRRRAGSEN